LLFSHKLLLILLVLGIVIVGVFILAKHDSLANKVEYVAAATKAAASGSKAVLAA
jgi:hypothetical protein